MWKREYIPDGHDLFRRAYPDQYNRKTGRFSGVAFKLRMKKGEEALSVSWSKYTTAEKASVDPQDRKFYVGELRAKVPRDHALQVIHTPNSGNRAHSSIKGEKLIDSPLLIARILSKNCRPLITSI